MPHTPGIWEAGPPEDDAPNYVRFVIRGNGEDDPSGDWEIAYVVNGPELLDGTDCVEGNAALLAAAPQLLAALKLCRARLKYINDARGQFASAFDLAAMDNADKAIAATEPPK